MYNDFQHVQWPGWETVGLIGRGSFGAVYEIRRDMFGEVEKAALKVISIPQNAGDIAEMRGDGYDRETITETFKNHMKSIVGEYSMMRRMNGSAHVVSCDDVRCIQHDDGIGWDIYIKMELLTPLMMVLPQNYNEGVVVRLAVDMCSALVLCQRHGIIHRDIKPQNIFISDNGDYKLGDFGVAKTVEKTSGGTKIGTYKYMAPEVYNNQPYGVGADIYSLGLVLYWMMNARRMPFMPLPPEKMKAGDEERSRALRFAGNPIPAPIHGSGELKRIVLKSCAFDPNDRYQNAREMLEDLQELIIRDRMHVSRQSVQSVPKTAAPARPPEQEDDRPTEHPAPTEDADSTVGLFPAPKRPGPSEQEERLRQEREMREARERQRRQWEEHQRLLREQEAARRRVEEETREAQTQKSASAGKKRKWWIPAAALCVVIAMLLGVWAMFGQSIESLGKPSAGKTETEGDRMEEHDHHETGPVKETVPQTEGTEPVPQTEVTDPVNEIVTVVLNVWAPVADLGRWLPEIEEKFAQEHPRYNIIWKNSEVYPADAGTRVAVDPANAADVFIYSSDCLFSLRESGAIAPLGGSSLEQIRRDVCTTYQNLVTGIDGKVYGFPLDAVTWFMYYNKSLLNEEDVKSLESCMAKGVVAFPVSNSWYLPAWFFAAGGTMFGEAGNDAAAGVQFGGEVGLAALNRLLDMMDHPNFLVVDSGEGSMGLQNGTVAAIFSGRWDYDLLYQSLGDNLGVAPVPSVTIGGTSRQLKAYANCNAVGVNPHADNIELAMEFASYLASAESQLHRFRLQGITPSITELGQHPEVMASPVAVAELATMVYASVPQPGIPEMNKVWGAMSTFCEDLRVGAITRQSAAERLEELYHELNANR